MAGALLLNASNEALCVVSSRRALILLLKDKAEMVAESSQRFHSERIDIAVPSVIRLVHYVRVPYRSTIPLSRRSIFARDQAACQYCGRAAENIDHVVPKSRGGRHAWDNVVACCRPCNARKKDRLLSECDLRLRCLPIAPKPSLWLVATSRNGDPARVDPTWRTFLGALSD